MALCVYSIWLIALMLVFIENNLIANTLFFLAAILAILQLFVRCESCGVLLYRKYSTAHGLPHPFYYIIEGECPVCKVKRV